MSLNARQKRFVEEYLIDLNATDAARRVGYKQPHVQGPRLLGNVSVAASISAAQQARSQSTGITAERVLAELDLLAHSDVGDILDFSGDEPRLKPANQIPERARRAISSVKVRRYVEGKGDAAKTVEVIEFKLWDKPAAVTKAMQHLGMLVDRHEITGKDGGSLTIKVIGGEASMDDI